MSYEHCNIHDEDATNGCPKCINEPEVKLPPPCPAHQGRSRGCILPIGHLGPHKYPIKVKDTCHVPETIDHPPHYNHGGIEVIDAIEAWKLGFHEGNVVKYVARAKHKNNELEDLKKARWYLDRRIKKLES